MSYLQVRAVTQTQINNIANLSCFPKELDLHDQTSLPDKKEKHVKYGW